MTIHQKPENGTSPETQREETKEATYLGVIDR